MERKKQDHALPAGLNGGAGGMAPPGCVHGSDAIDIGGRDESEGRAGGPKGGMGGMKDWGKGVKVGGKSGV